MAYKGFSGSGTVGNFLSTTQLELQFPAVNHAGRRATVEATVGQVTPYFCDGVSWNAEVTATTNPVTGGISLSAGGSNLGISTYKTSITGLPTCMSFGNSISNLNRLASDTVAGSISYPAPLWWALTFLGHPFSWVQTGAEAQIGADANSSMAQGVYRYSGATSVTIAQYLTTVVTPYSPSYCFLHLMENDITAIVGATITRAQAKAAYLQVIQALLSAGTIPIFVGCLPSKSYSSAALAAEYWALTDYVESLQKSYSGIIYVPVSDLYMDSSLTTPQPLSSGVYANYVDASVHPQSVGPLLGKRIADVLNLRGIKGFGLVPGPGDVRLIGGNAFTSGTAGSVSAPVTGSVVNNLTCANNTTTASIAASVVDYQNRQAQQIVITSGTSTGFQNAFQLYTAPIAVGASTFAIGDTVQSFVEITIDSATTLAGLRDLSLQMQHTGGPNGYSMFFKSSGVLFDTNTIPAGTKMLIATPLSVVQSGTTAIRVLLYAYASNNAAAISGKFTITKFAVVNWSKTN